MGENKITVRLANYGDLKYVMDKEHLSEEIVLRKMDQGEIFVLCVENEPVGYLRIEFLWSAIPYIALIRIEEGHRKKGYSRILLGFLEDHLHEKGFRVLYSSSQVDEPQPQLWHRHMGFTECGILTGINEGGIGEVFFKKTL